MEAGAAVARRFTVDTRLKVLRAGEVFPESGAGLRAQSPSWFSKLCRGFGLGERRGGDCWLKSEGVDLLASLRRDKGPGGLRFSAYKDPREEVLFPGPYRQLSDSRFRIVEHVVIKF